LDPAGLNRAQDSDDIEPQSHLGFDQSGNLLKVPDGTKAFEENRIFQLKMLLKWTKMNVGWLSSIKHLWLDKFPLP
jgi:hypothetical protein